MDGQTVALLKSSLLVGPDGDSLVFYNEDLAHWLGPLSVLEEELGADYLTGVYELIAVDNVELIG